MYALWSVLSLLGIALLCAAIGSWARRFNARRDAEERLAESDTSGDGEEAP